jgi:hypothetical protein
MIMMIIINKSNKRLMLVILSYALLHNVHCVCPLLGQEPQPPGALCVYLGLYRDSFTVAFTNFPEQKAQLFRDLKK